MLREDQNSKENLKSHIKDTTSLSMTFNQGSFYSKFSNKINKLITALYMVTDIMDKEEPLRGKLRSLGVNVISDTHSITSHTDKKIAEILSFLEIASVVGMISEMNFSILKKEFTELRQSIEESSRSSLLFGGQTSLSDFLKSSPERPTSSGRTGIGQFKQARIGVQKGSTLMQALSDRIPSLSDTHNPGNYNVLKDQRRQEIIKIIKNKVEANGSNFYGLTITDIKNLATGALTASGEKTLQRELVSMVQDGVLKKIGDKRWSKYFLV